MAGVGSPPVRVGVGGGGAGAAGGRGETKAGASSSDFTVIGFGSSEERGPLVLCSGLGSPRIARGRTSVPLGACLCLCCKRFQTQEIRGTRQNLPGETSTDWTISRVGKPAKDRRVTNDSNLATRFRSNAGISPLVNVIFGRQPSERATSSSFRKVGAGGTLSPLAQ